jgi:hypothetical protein
VGLRASGKCLQFAAASDIAAPFRCGGSEFTMSETDAFAVCVGCGTQARETINTAWNDWAEEQGTYGSFAARGGVRVRRLRRNRRGAKAKPLKPTLSVRLDGKGDAVDQQGTLNFFFETRLGSRPGICQRGSRIAMLP